MKLIARATIKVAFEPMLRGVETELGKRSVQCALLVERAAKVSMKRGGRRSGRKTGVPSAPGTPPHVQVGALRASIATGRTETGAVVGPVAKYGKFHEFGTRLHPKRPFMRPALDKVMPHFAREFRRLVK